MKDCTGKCRVEACRTNICQLEAAIDALIRKGAEVLSLDQENYQFSKTFDGPLHL